MTLSNDPTCHICLLCHSYLDWKSNPARLLHARSLMSFQLICISIAHAAVMCIRSKGLPGVPLSVLLMCWAVLVYCCEERARRQNAAAWLDQTTKQFGFKMIGSMQGLALVVLVVAVTVLVTETHGWLGRAVFLAMMGYTIIE